MKNIYKYLILSFVLSLTGIDSFSQNFHAGPKGGVTFTQVDGDGYGGYHKVGYNIGGFVYRQISKNNRWDLQFEIEYMKKGSRHTPDYETGNMKDYNLTLNYMQIPIIVRYNMRHVSLEAGISIGTLVSSKEILDYEEIDYPFKTMEYAGILGINYHFTPKLWINGRYSVSLASIRAPYEEKLPMDLWGCRKPGQYNRILEVSVYYAFNGNHKL